MKQKSEPVDAFHSSLVVFDLGRVLVRLCNDWEHACELAGVAVSAPSAKPDPSEQARLDELFHGFDTGKVDLHAFAHGVGPARGLTVEQVIAVNNVYLRGPFPGAGELIDELHALGHVTACLSNTNASHWRMLTGLDNSHGPVLAKLRHQFASHLIGVRKPDAGIYAHLERETGFAPPRIIFFDDMAENVAAARVRGWAAHLVDVCDNPIPAIRQRLREARVLR